MEMIREGITYKGTPAEIMEVLQRLPKITKAVALMKNAAAKPLPRKPYKKRSRYHVLSIEDREFILQNKEKLNNSRMAKKIGCSVSAVWYFLNSIEKKEQKIALVGKAMSEEKASLL